MVVTIKDTVASNKTDIATESLIFHPDSKLIRHSINLCQHVFKKVIINTVDTDILRLAIAYSHEFVEYGVEPYIVKLEMRDDAKCYNILQLCNTIGHEKCLALSFFRAFTGCDSNSSFYRQEKCKC